MVSGKTEEEHEQKNSSLVILGVVTSVLHGMAAAAERRPIEGVHDRVQLRTDVRRLVDLPNTPARHLSSSPEFDPAIAQHIARIAAQAYWQDARPERENRPARPPGLLSVRTETRAGRTVHVAEKVIYKGRAPELLKTEIVGSNDRELLELHARSLEHGRRHARLGVRIGSDAVAETLATDSGRQLIEAVRQLGVDDLRAGDWIELAFEEDDAGGRQHAFGVSQQRRGRHIEDEPTVRHLIFQADFPSDKPETVLHKVSDSTTHTPIDIPTLDK